MDAWSESQQRDWNLRTYREEPPRVMPRPKFTKAQLDVAVRVLNEKEGK